MARIRTIKPEFFSSSDVLALTPLARVLYIALWCEADREGRMEWKPDTFGFRYLPQERDQVQSLCDEIVGLGLITLYGDGLAYIPKFSKHQAINNKEHASTLPDPDACNTRESGVLGERKEGKEGKEGKEWKGKEDASTAGSSTSRFVKPTPEEIHAYMIERLWIQPDGQKFFDSYEVKGWMVGKNPMKDWKAAVRTWETSEWFKGRGGQSSPKSATPVLGVDYINVELENGDIAEFKPGHTADDHKNPDAWFDRTKWGGA